MLKANTLIIYAVEPFLRDHPYKRLIFQVRPLGDANPNNCLFLPFIKGHHFLKTHYMVIKRLAPKEVL